MDSAMCHAEKRRLADQLLDASAKRPELSCRAHGLKDRVQLIVVRRANALDFRKWSIQRRTQASQQLTRGVARLHHQIRAWSRRAFRKYIGELTAALVKVVCGVSLLH